MRFTARRGVSPIIATLLLIAIAVAAGIIVYVFVNSLSGNLTQQGGQQLADQVSMDAYTFPNSGATTCTGGVTNPCVQIVLRDTGSTSVTFGSIYFDGNLCQTSGVTCTASPYSTAETCTDGTGLWSTAANIPSCTAGQYVVLAIGPISAASATSGTSHILRLLTSDGGTFTFTVIAGRSG